jgi:hypothetical protein
MAGEVGGHAGRNCSGEQRPDAIAKGIKKRHGKGMHVQLKVAQAFGAALLFDLAQLSLQGLWVGQSHRCQGRQGSRKDLIVKRQWLVGQNCEAGRGCVDRESQHASIVIFLAWLKE